MMRKATAELLGTFWLVFLGIGAATFAGEKIGILGIGLAFGLAVMAMVYTLGHISGCHLNPAVSLALVVTGRMPMRELPAYLLAQLAGAVLAAGTLMLLLMSAPGELWTAAREAGFASNGYGEHSPGGFGLGAALTMEILLTGFFVLTILGATSSKVPAGFAGLAIGLCLAAIHLLGIPVTNLSANPARSTATALFTGGWAMMQLWAFWVAPLLGGLAAGVVYRFALAGERPPHFEEKVAHRAVPGVGEPV